MKSLVKFLFILCIVPVSAQTLNKEYRSCATDEFQQLRMQNDPQAKQLYEEARRTIKKPLSFNKKNDTTVKIIPVVFHILHNYGPENVSKQNILDLLKTLNEDWRLKNSDTFNIRSQFKGLKADFRYDFRLATKDPNGNCTDGIERIATLRTYNASDDDKQISVWDNSKYFNIWVCAYIDRTKVRVGTILGYAQFPWDVRYRKTDGVILISSEVAKGKRTLTHEAGHWAGLFHTFQDGCQKIAGDFCDDTPPVKEANFGCPDNINSCQESPIDLPDMTENYMDYADCKYMFTNDQKTRIDSFMSIYRSSLFNDSNLRATGVINPANNCSPVADFYSDSKTICLNNSLKFYNNSFNAPITSYQWEFEGGNPSTSTSANPTVTYASTGTFKVKLTVSNNFGSNSKTIDQYVKVIDNNGAVNSPYYNDFESNNLYSEIQTSSDYSAENGWMINSSVGFQSKKCIWINNYFNQYKDLKYIFETPSINLSQSIQPLASFKLAFSRQLNSNTDAIKVYGSSDCGATYKLLLTKSADKLATTYPQGSNWFPNSDYQWNTISVNLAAFRNASNFKLRVEFTSGGGNNIYLDNISIGDKSVGIEPKSDSKLSINVYPNPVNEQLNINLNVNDNIGNQGIFITDFQGKIVYRNVVNINSGTNLIQINTDNLSKGIYLVVVGNSSTKFIK